MKALYKKTFSAWEPIDEQGLTILNRHKLGDIVEIEVKAKRNIEFHKRFFAIINLTFQNQDISDNINDFREAVTIAAGYYHYQKQVDGSEIKRADSISFSSMDQLYFEQLDNQVFNICLKILGCKSEELELELLKFA